MTDLSQACKSKSQRAADILEKAAGAAPAPLARMLRACVLSITTHPRPAQLMNDNAARLNAEALCCKKLPPGMTLNDICAAADAFANAGIELAGLRNG